MTMSSVSAASDFDPNAPFVDQETGLLYEDFAAFVAGQPLDCTRNGNVLSYRTRGYREEAIRGYWRAFDAFPSSDPEFGSREFAYAHGAGLDGARAVGGFFPDPVRPYTRPADPG